MKPEPRLVAQRALARHCPELLGDARPAEADNSAELTRFGVRLARALAKALGPLLGGASGPTVTCADPRETTAAALPLEIAAFAANSLLGAGQANAPVLASIDAAATLRIVDRAFGGRGEAPDPLPEAFPLSAELMIARIEAQVAACLAEAAGLTGDDAVRPLRRDSSLAQLAPFTPDTPVTVLALKVEEPGRSPWELVLALPAPAIAVLAGSPGGEPAASRALVAPRGPASPHDEPWADIDLPLSAVVVDMRVPFSTLARLAPGMVLPVAVARAVPLRIGERTIGHGAIGAVDDRVAVQINRIF